MSAADRSRLCSEMFEYYFPLKYINVPKRMLLTESECIQFLRRSVSSDQTLKEFFAVCFYFYPGLDVGCAEFVERVSYLPQLFDEAQSEGIFSWVKSAFDATVSLVSGVTKSVKAVIQPFISAFAKNVFMGLISDIYPINIVTSVVGVLNRIFSPIAERFAEVFDLFSTDVTPTDFFSAMNSGTT